MTKIYNPIYYTVGLLMMFMYDLLRSMNSALYGSQKLEKDIDKLFILLF